MASRTISLEKSAYEKLRAAKGPKESFSDVVHRVLETRRPSLTALAGFLTSDEAREVRATLTRLRQEDAGLERERAVRWEVPHGRRRRQ